MAHPDEPQRAVAPRSALGWFAVALVACLAIYVAIAVPGSWFPGAATQVVGARSLALARGTGAMDGDALAVSAADAGGVAVISAKTDFRSAEYPVVAWTGFGFAPTADVRFLWQTDYAPNKINSIPVSVAAGRLAPVVMAKNPDWVGRITGVALAIRAPIAEPPHVVSFAAKPGGVAGQLADRVREWFAFEPWSGTSINTITGGADVQELPLPTLLVIAAMIALLIWFVLAWRKRRLAAFPAAVALLFLFVWGVLDAAWTANLARQVSQTRDQYGGKDWRERHLAADDGALFAFVEKARAKMPASPARVFVVADAAYFRGRGAYHLYPHNVLYDPFRNSLPQGSSLKPGDYVLVFHRRGLQYNANEKKLAIEGGEPVSAEAVLVEPGAALLKIL